MITRRQCIVPNCNRHALSGSMVCWPHRKSRTARDWDTTLRQAARDADEAIAGGEASDAAHQFRRRVAHGEYRDLFDAPLARILAQAAERHDLDDELGAVRYALARLLAEEQDPSRLALGVARLTRAAVTTSRERRESQQAEPDGLTEAMTRVLADLDAEKDHNDSKGDSPGLVPLHYPTPEERSLG